MVALILWLARSEHALVPYNATAPAPVTNTAFAAALGQALHRPPKLPVPAFALRLLLGEMAGLLLTGQRVLPTRAMRQGFVFSDPELPATLASMLAQ